MTLHDIVVFSLGAGFGAGGLFSVMLWLAHSNAVDRQKARAGLS